MVSHFYLRLRLFALTYCYVGYRREKPSEEECLLTVGRGMTCDPSTVMYCHKCIFYLKHWEVYFKCIYRQCCQSSCLSTAPAVLIYRQLYLVVVLFLGSKRRVCLVRKKIGDTLCLSLGLLACTFSFSLSLSFLVRFNILWQRQSPPEPL